MSDVTKWTPGPWVVGNGLDMKSVYGGKHEQLLAISTGEDYGSYFGDDTDDIECMEQANAHLIAAAPDMYKALQTLARNFPDCATQDAVDALAKARGEQ